MTPVLRQQEVWIFPDSYLLLLWRISEAVTGVKHGEVVHILDVSLLEVQLDIETFSKEVNGIQGFSLVLSDGWDGLGPRKSTEASERPPCVLQNHPLWVIGRSRLMI
jgi:hypothetical protein